jgi:hypothetical protein
VEVPVAPGNGSGEALAATHLDGIASAGTATTTFVVSRAKDGRTMSIQQTRALNLETEQLMYDGRIEATTLDGAVSTQLLRLQQYQTPNERYTNTTTGLTNGSLTQYNGSTAGNWGGSNLSEIQYEPVVEGAGNITWTRTGTGTLDGTQVVRYEAADPGNVSGFETNVTIAAETTSNESDGKATINMGNLSVQDAEATLLLGSDGIVRQLSYDINATESGNDVDYRMQLSVRDVGDTTVAKPAWADSVKQNATTPDEDG